MKEKARLRSICRSRLENLSEDERRRQERTACAVLMADSLWREADWIYGYLPMGHEFDCEQLLDAAVKDGKRLALPRVAGKRLRFHSVPDMNQCWVLHPYGMREPEPHLPEIHPDDDESPVLILVPGLGFTADGSRLGYGGGYYDGFLGTLNRPVSTVSLVYREQLFPHIPTDTHDVKIDRVISGEAADHNLMGRTVKEQRSGPAPGSVADS